MNSHDVGVEIASVYPPHIKFCTEYARSLKACALHLPIVFSQVDDTADERIFMAHNCGPALAKFAQLSLALALVFALSQTGFSQCVDHPEKKTALKFINETRVELTFFVDEDEEGLIVPSRTVSDEIPVEAGEHMLRAKAMVRGEPVWIWTVNDVPTGQLCVWTITDP